MVNLIDGNAFDAILYAKRGPLLELRDVTYLEAGRTEAVAIDGAVIIERPRVAFIQIRD